MVKMLGESPGNYTDFGKGKLKTIPLWVKQSSCPFLSL